jgi:hypothetical protein
MRETLKMTMELACHHLHTAKTMRIGWMLSLKSIPIGKQHKLGRREIVVKQRY